MGEPANGALQQEQDMAWAGQGSNIRKMVTCSPGRMADADPGFTRTDCTALRRLGHWCLFQGWAATRYRIRSVV